MMWKVRRMHTSPDSNCYKDARLSRDRRLYAMGISVVQSEKASF